MSKLGTFGAIVLLLILVSCSGKNNLEIEIEGIGSDTVYIEYMALSKMGEINEPIRDTLFSKENKLITNIEVKEPNFVFISFQKGIFKRVNKSNYIPRSKYLLLVLEPNSNIKVKGKMHGYYLDYEVTGNNLNKTNADLRKRNIKELVEACKIELKLDTLMFNRPNIKQEGKNKEAKKDIEKRDAEIKELFAKRRAIDGEISKRNFKYIKNNLDKDISAYLLTKQKLDTLGKYYEELSKGVRNGIFKNMLDNSLLRYKKSLKIREAQKNVIEGSIAPNFKLKSLSGADFSLNSVNDKYVVIDFWGSWCGWCIHGFPKMKEYYKKYKNHVEFIGIACGDTETKWKEAVEKHKLEWVNLLNNKELETDVAVIYAITGYPTKFILDKEKKIVAKFVGESEEFYKKLDEIMKK